MKKIISVTLLFVMLFSLTAASLAEEKKTSTTNIEVSTFFKAFPFFTMNKGEDEVMTRAEFAQVVTNILSYRDSNFSVELGDLVVEDIEEAESYQDAVKTLVKVGYMQGAKVGTNTYRFSPKQEVTPKEVIKVMIDILGYKDYVAYKGGYPTGYLSVANSLGILKGVSISVDKSATVATVMKLVFNALNTEVAEVGISSGSLTITNKKGETYLSERFKIKKIDGLFKANSMIHITGQNATVGNSINIDDEIYYSENTYENFNYIGSYVRAYVDTYEKTDGEIVCLYPIENRSKAHTLALRNLETTANLLKIKTVEDETEYQIDKNAGVYYNFEYLGPVRSLDYKDVIIAAILGLFGNDVSAEIVLTDNNGDNSADFVWIRSYDNILLKSFVYDSFKFSNAYNNNAYEAGKNLSGIEMKTAFEKNKVYFYDTDRNTFNPKNFEKDDVISLITKIDAEGKVQATLGIVSKNTVRGNIVETSDDGLLIGDALYQKSAEYARLLTIDSSKVEELKAGLESLFYLDAFGLIVGLNQSETVEGGDKTLAFLFKVNKGTGLSGAVTAMLYGTDGEKSIIEFDASVKINGSVKKNDNIYSYLNSIAEERGDKTCVIYRMVKYQLKDGKISSIDIYAYQTKAFNDSQSIANQEAERDSDLYPYIFMNSSENSANTVFKANTIGKRIGITTDTTILSVPSLAGGVDFSALDDEAFYQVKYSDLSGDNIFGDSAYSATTNSGGIASNPIQMAFYEVDNTLFSGLALKYYQYVSGSVNVSNPELLNDCVIVEQIVQGINKDDEPVLVFYGMQKGSPVRVQSEPIADINAVWSKYPALQYYLQKADKSKKAAEQIKVGDAIQVLYNSKSEMINALVLMRAADKDNAAWLLPDKPSNPAYPNLDKLKQGQGNEYLAVNYGTIVEYADGKLVLDELDGVRRVYLLGSTTITSFNRTTKKVAKASTQDLEVGKDIFIRQYYSGIKEAVYYID